MPYRSFTENVGHRTLSILEELGKLRDTVTGAELNKAKELSKGRLMLSLEDSRNVAAWVAARLADSRLMKLSGRAGDVCIATAARRKVASFEISPMTMRRFRNATMWKAGNGLRE